MALLPLFLTLAFAEDTTPSPALAPVAEGAPDAPPALLLCPPVTMVMDPTRPIDLIAAPPASVECTATPPAEPDKKKKGLKKSDNGRMEAEETRE